MSECDGFGDGIVTDLVRPQVIQSRRFMRPVTDVTDFPEISPIRREYVLRFHPLCVNCRNIRHSVTLIENKALNLSQLLSHFCHAAQNSVTDFERSKPAARAVAGIVRSPAPTAKHLDAGVLACLSRSVALFAGMRSSAQASDNQDTPHRDISSVPRSCGNISHRRADRHGCSCCA